MHPCPRARAPASVALVAFLLVSLHTGVNAGTKPHPLFGNTVLGNSAEIVTLWPTGSGGLSNMRITDFNSAAEPDELVPKSAYSLTGGIPTASYQQLDVAVGDFDFDGRDDVVAAYSMPTADPWTQTLCLVVPDAVEADLSWSSAWTGARGTLALPPDSYRSPSNVRLIAGNFDDDDPQEFVLGTRTAQSFPGAPRAATRFGIGVAQLGDIDGDGNPDLAVGGDEDDDGGTDCGAVWILFMDGLGGIRSYQKISMLEGGFTGTLDPSDRFGFDVAWLDDVDGDGVGDIAVGAPWDGDGGTRRGAVWILFLNSDGTVKAHQKISQLSGGFPETIEDYGIFGDALDAIGDRDGDGITELAVAAPWMDRGGATNNGLVWILKLNASGQVTAVLSEIPGEPNSGDAFGYGVTSLGDLDGDGLGDLAIGSPYDDDGGTDRGAVYIVLLDSALGVKAQQKISSSAGGFTGTLANYAQFGVAVERLDDLDGDGTLDLAVGAYGMDGAAGAVWVLFLNSDGTVDSCREIAGGEGGFPAGVLEGYDYFGRGLAMCGIDGDGKLGLAVGAFSDDDAGETAGAVYILSLNTDGTVAGYRKHGGLATPVVRIELMELDDSRRPVTLAAADCTVQADDLRESARFDVAAGDFDGDGIDEIVVTGLKRVTDTGHLTLFVQIYAYQNHALVLRAESEWGDFAGADEGWSCAGDVDDHCRRIDHMAVATGALQYKLVDSILLSWLDTQSWYHDHGWPNGECGSTEHEYMVSTAASLIRADVDSTWQILWRSPAISKSVSRIVENCCEKQYMVDRRYSGQSLGLATGDLTGDGIDEVVWAAAENLRVFQVDTTDLTLAERTSIALAAGGFNNGFQYKDPSRRVVGIVDLDASGQEDMTDWGPEIVVQDWGGTGGTQRLRVFRANVNTVPEPDSITGLTLLCLDNDLSAVRTNGDVAMVFGDFDGDGVRLGTPTRVEINEVIQPVVILGAPPVHFDWFDQPYDLSGCFDNGYYICDDFRATYSLETSGQFAVNTEVRGDWGISSSLKTSLSVNALCFKLGGMENTFTARFGGGFSRTNMQSHSYEALTAVAAEGGDRILADITSYALWEYPVRDPEGEVLGHVAVIEPDSPVILTQWLSFDSWAGMSGGRAPAINHEPGNILSYMKEIPATDEYGDMWEAEVGQGWEVAPPGTFAAAQALDAPYSWDLDWSKISSGTYSKSWSAGAEIVNHIDFAGLTIPTGIPCVNLKVKMALTTKASYDHSELRTHSTSVGERIHLGVTLGDLAPTTQGNYVVWPFAYRSEEAGILLLDYKVLPTGEWWDRYRDDPDLTFILPRLHRLEKGGSLEDTTSKYRSPDVRVYPFSAAVGDTVTIVAIVRNFSLVDENDPVTVRFYAGDPDGSCVPIQDLGGQTDFSIADGIPSREGRSVALQWVVPPNVPTEVRIHAKADPYGAVTEVHENNNKAYTEFVAVGGLPVDVPQPVAGDPFTLRQSAPNPFLASTAIRFSLSERARATLRVYDVAGRLVATLVDAELLAGRHVYRWNGTGDDGRAVAPGIYLYRIEAGPNTETRRLVRLR